MNTKERGRVLMDQKANSVADLAAVLLQDEAGPSEELIEHKKQSKRFWDRVNRSKVRAGKPPTNKNPNLALAPVVEGVRIRWANIMDAKYAEAWPQSVAHHTLERSRYTAAFPAYEMVDLEADELDHVTELPQQQEETQMANQA